MKKFTLVELLAVIAIIGILVSILLPSLAKARNKAMIAVCSSNLRQSGTGKSGYLKDHNYKFPYKVIKKKKRITNWFGRKGTTGKLKVEDRPINPYLQPGAKNGDDVFVARCPSKWGYGMYEKDGNAYGSNKSLELPNTLGIKPGVLSVEFLSEINNPSFLLSAHEKPAKIMAHNSTGEGYVIHGYQDRFNAVFCDGSVKKQLIFYYGTTTDHTNYGFSNLD